MSLKDCIRSFRLVNHSLHRHQLRRAHEGPHKTYFSPPHAGTSNHVQSHKTYFPPPQPETPKISLWGIRFRWLALGIGLSTLGPCAYVVWYWKEIKEAYIALRVRLQYSILPLEYVEKPEHNIKASNIRVAKQELVSVVGHAGVDDNPGNLKSRSSTEWSPYPSKVYASLVVFPQSTEHVSKIMKICHKRSIPAIGYAGGTSLDGALASTRGGICIDFSRMNRILELHDRDMDVVVQPAVGWEDLNAQLADKGLFFPPDPGPGAQIGGMIGTGCSGTNAYRYGTMKDWVVALTIVLADGTIVKTRNRPRKSTAGYDLTRLIVGSAGTLGLVTEAVLKVTAKPENEQVAVVAFPNSYKAVSTVIDVVEKGIPLAAIELLDDTTMRAVNQSGVTSKKWKETAMLFVKFSGTENAVREQVDVLNALAEKYDRESFESSSDPEQIKELWGARKGALWSLLAQKRHANDKFLSCDVAVPMSRLADIIEETKKKIEEAGLLGSTLGHVGDGNFHATILYSEDEKAAAEKIIADTQRRGVDMEGTITGEHGIGLSLRDMLVYELGDQAVDMMRKIKYALDPKCLLNCDKIVRVEPDEKPKGS